MGCSLLGSSVHGIFQAIVLEWIAISFSRGSSQPRDRTRASNIVDRRLTVWATREGIEPRFPALEADALTSEPPGKWETSKYFQSCSPPDCVHAQSLSCIRLFRNPMDCVAHQASLSMGFPRQEYWSRLPFFRGSSWPRHQTLVSCNGRGTPFTSEPPEKAHSVHRVF